MAVDHVLLLNGNLMLQLSECTSLKDDSASCTIKWLLTNVWTLAIMQDLDSNLDITATAGPFTFRTIISQEPVTEQQNTNISYVLPKKIMTLPEYFYNFYLLRTVRLYFSFLQVDILAHTLLYTTFQLHHKELGSCPGSEEAHWYSFTWGISIPTLTTAEGLSSLAFCLFSKLSIALKLH